MLRRRPSGDGGPGLWFQLLPKSGLNRAFAAAALVTSIAFTTGGGALLGYLADGWLGTGPWLFLLGTFVGFAVGLRRLFQALQQWTDDPDDHPPDHPA